MPDVKQLLSKGARVVPKSDPSHEFCQNDSPTAQCVAA